MATGIPCDPHPRIRPPTPTRPRKGGGGASSPSEGPRIHMRLPCPTGGEGWGEGGRLELCRRHPLVSGGWRRCEMMASPQGVRRPPNPLPGERRPYPLRLQPWVSIGPAAAVTHDRTVA